MKDCVGQYISQDNFSYQGMMGRCLSHALSLPTDRDKRFGMTRRGDYKETKTEGMGMLFKHRHN